MATTGSDVDDMVWQRPWGQIVLMPCDQLELRPNNTLPQAPDKEPAPAPAAAEETSEDDESTAYEAELKDLLEKKEAAKAEEDFDRAEQLKDQVQQLKEKELARLKEKKDEALKQEKYLEAKSIKARIAKLEL
ncbi:hypothetical protein AK812_SmicGene18295 [Symbiodinium microadriaticum]|uniref:UVR domain-containing protein n=1 Tax=Symbiodinium microadriaticum TaxID=2951 RepID=A0A1Q9DVJ0_SYMMI|nr:hypothetical protein AK812_SmicGene18295 [Symbiodinium microadriaticum]